MYTDNDPLTYILTSNKLDKTGHHWVAGLTNYNFTINSKSGKVNVDANALSPILWEDHNWHGDADTVQSLISNTTQGSHFDRGIILQYTGQ